MQHDAFLSPSPFHSLYPLANYISYDSLSQTYRNLVLNVSANFKPQFYHQTVHYPQWKTTMQTELNAMEKNHKWFVVFLPSGKHSVGCKWVYKIKYKQDGFVDRHKACLVAKRYIQQEGIDFFKTFSPVAKLVTVKVLLALAATHGWHISQLDVNNAFINGNLSEEICMDLSLGYIPLKTQADLSSKMVCKLYKSIYGLRQASRQWYSKFSQALLHSGFSQSHSDHTLLTKGTGSSLLLFSCM